MDDNQRSSAGRVQYHQYPSTIGSDVQAWVEFSAYDFKSHAQTQSIALYIPGDALNTSYKSEYESVGLGMMGAAGSKVLGQAMTATKDNAISRIKTMTDSVMEGAKSEGKTVTAIESAKFVSGFKGAAGAKTIMEKQQGAVLNPYIVAAYKGPTDMRAHDFTFQMLPQDIKESKACMKIATAFKTAMLPSHGKANATNAPSMLFGYPDEFEINFFVNGLPMPKTSNNPMFNIGRSVLTACDLDYSTESVALFFDDTQYPVSISMKLSFMELELMHRGKIQKGF